MRPIEGRHVLIVEDIIDSGLTLQYLLRNLEGRGPASLAICALLTKPARRKVALPTRYVGFEIPIGSRSATAWTTASATATCPTWQLWPGTDETREDSRRARCTGPSRRPESQTPVLALRFPWPGLGMSITRRGARPCA